MLEIRTQHIQFKERPDIQIGIRREDMIHPLISGNKYRKLKYNLIRAKEDTHHTILTFGGAFSNHILATAYASSKHGLNSIGVIRGEELENNFQDNPTLKAAESYGMKFVFVTREDYRKKEDIEFKEELKFKYGRFYSLPEGGTNDLAIKGCEEILNSKDKIYDFVTTSVGTGGTIAGLINASSQHQKVFGFPALKGDFLKRDIRNFVSSKNWDLISDYHFGGYAKINKELITFINSFSTEFGILLDPIYTGKMMFGLKDLISKGAFPENSKILAIHTGGLQGIKGMNMRLELKKMPLINEK